jgi:branched-subunit amino acid aminotransferase/4-amino-4-deoxychorismate lyase
MLLPSVLAKREARRQGASEALLVGASGHVHEGASSNVFLVEGRDVMTPPLSASLLPGTLRPLVCEVARDAGFRVRHEALHQDRFAQADEVFVSSSSQLAMPVLAIDGRPVGEGCAGTITLEIAARIRQRFELPD